MYPRSPWFYSSRTNDLSWVDCDPGAAVVEAFQYVVELIVATLNVNERRDNFNA